MRAANNELEKNLGALARALDPSIVIVRKRDGVINVWTAGCERLYGWTAQQAAGQVIHELLQTKYPEPLQEIERQLEQEGIWQGEIEQIRRDGTRAYVATHWVLLNDGATEASEVVETHTDITARLEMQRELENANKRLQSMAEELERSNEELEEFARIASHDLSAPITSTRWLVELLATRHANGLDDGGRKCLEQISRGLDRMGELVEAVLKHAQVGKHSISGESTPAERAASLAIENLRKHIETSGAVIECAPLPEVQVEPQALTQLFQNLISNAIKYRRNEVPPRLFISASSDGTTCEFSVSDNGIGIEPQWFERIFQPMQRLHGRDIAGSGIGLATCKKIVTRAGGRIWVESVVGTGSTFRFTLCQGKKSAE